jgi:hypothetical protein
MLPRRHPRQPGRRHGRGCCGIWTGSHRIACPLNSSLEDGTDPQCTACAAAALDDVLPAMAPETESLIDELLPSWRTSVA